MPWILLCNNSKTGKFNLPALFWRIWSRKSSGKVYKKRLFEAKKTRKKRFNGKCNLLQNGKRTTLYKDDKKCQSVLEQIVVKKKKSLRRKEKNAAKVKVVKLYFSWQKVVDMILYYSKNRVNATHIGCRGSTDYRSSRSDRGDDADAVWFPTWSIALSVLSHAAPLVIPPYNTVFGEDQRIARGPRCHAV